MSIYTRIREAFALTPSPAVLAGMDTPVRLRSDAVSEIHLPQTALVKERSFASGTPHVMEEFVQIPLGKDGISSGLLFMPEQCLAAIVLSHDPATGTHCGTNRGIARMLHHMGFATLLMDVGSAQPATAAAHHQKNASQLANRLVGAANWLAKHPCAEGLPLGYVGSGTAAESALIASARRPDLGRAVVGVAWKPDPQKIDASQVTAPTLLIAGGADAEMARINLRVLGTIASREKDLELIPGATHLFEGPGTLEAAAIRSGRWFERHLVRAVASPRQDMLAMANWP